MNPSIQRIRTSDGSGNASVATVQTTRSGGASTIIVDTVQGIPDTFYGSMGTPHTFVDPVTSETITVISEATAVDFAGHVDGTNLEIDEIAPGYVDGGSAVGDIIVIRPTTPWGNNIADLLEPALEDDGEPKVSILNPVGTVVDYAGVTAPSGWLLCYGQAVSRSTYADLFTILNPSVGTFTITIASPGVVTLNSHGLETGGAVYLTTTGALPTGLTANTRYFIIKTDANTFRLATSYANAVAGTAINTSGTQSGTHTTVRSPYGIGDGSTTFNLPDLRGRVVAGSDIMGGTSADRLTSPATTLGGINGDVLGNTGGAETHKLVEAQQERMRVRSDGSDNWNQSTGGSQSGWAFNAAGANNGIYTVWAGTKSTGNNDGHNNVQPTLIMNKIIKH